MKSNKKKFIDTNYDSSEKLNINNDEKIIVFVLTNPYSLFVAIYYAIKLKDNKCVAIWDKSNIEDYEYDFNFAKKYFYKFFFIKGVRGKNKFIKWMYKLNYIGYFHRYCCIFQFLSKFDNLIFCIFSDVDCITQVILNDYGLRNIVILGDEGFSIYDSKPKKANLIFSRFLAYILLGTKYESEYIGESNRIDVLMLNYPNMIKNKFILNPKQVIEANNPFLDKEFVKKINCELGIKDLLHVDENHKYYLYIGSPISDLGLNENDEIKSLRILINCLKNDEIIVIKSHPREDVHKYDEIKNEKNVILINSKDFRWMPIELIVKKIKPICIITIISVAAYNIVRSGDCPYAIYFVKCLSKSQQDFLQNFINKEGIFTIRTIEEFHDIKEKIDRSINNDCIKIKKMFNKNIDIRFFKNILND